MRDLCHCIIILVLATLLSSALARPKAYEDRDKQENVLSAARKYLLRQYENGIIKLCIQRLVN